MRIPAAFLCLISIVQPISAQAAREEVSSEDLKRVSFWKGVPERHWAGPDFWCNRLEDWTVKNDYLVAEAPEDAHCRTAHLVTYELTDIPGSFHLRVNIRTGNGAGNGSFAGFLVGAGEGKLDHRGAALVHHYPGKGGGLLAVIETSTEPALSFRDMSVETFSAEYPVLSQESVRTSGKTELSGDLVLQLDVVPGDQDVYTMNLSLLDPDNGRQIASVSLNDVDPSKLLGNVALVSHQAGNRITHSFRQLLVGGEKLRHIPERSLGPVASTLYSVSGNTLKISAQCMHMGSETFLTAPAGSTDAANSGRRNNRVRLLAHLERQEPNGEWEVVDGPKAVVGPEFYLLFRVEGWNSSEDARVRVAFRDWNGKYYYYPTRITRDPVDKEVVSAAGFTGMGAIGRSPHYRGSPADEDEVLIGRWTPANVWTPFNKEVNALMNQDVDILFFTGDQVYENKPTRKDWSISPFKDYLYKWLIWCWSFRDLTNHLPAMVQPDDHDVYHGNIWGWGGKLNLTGQNGDGGYLRSPAFVNMVHRTMSGHLPDTYGPVPAGNGILNYYTRFNWGEVGFAVMEDRKFKTPPQIEDPSRQILLGEGQMEMLEQWGQDWSGHQFKCMVSQTIYASMHVDFEGNIREDPDSNGFPKVRRDELLDLLRKSGVFILSGDQHLATFARLGVDQPSDAVYQFAVPAMGNYFWRWFYPNTPGEEREPGAPDYTGEFADGFGNYFRMVAVANPERRSLMDQRLRQRYIIPREEIENGMADQRRPCLGDGYGIVRFDKSNGEVKVECWPYNATPGDDGGQFEGWPVTLDADVLDGRQPAAWLPDLVIRGNSSPAIQIIDQESGELIKSVRIRNERYSPSVYQSDGLYTVRIGDPDSSTPWQEFRDLEPLKKKGSRKLQVELLSGRGIED